MIQNFTEWWNAMSGVEHIYYGIAIVFTVLFLIQLIITLIGLDPDLDMDLHDFDGGFSIISLRGIIAFGVFFGWGGVLALNMNFKTPQVLMLAFLAGFIAMVAVAYIFAQILKLQESGTVDLSEAIMQKADVYLSIPPGGHETGKISLSLKGKLMEFEAITFEDKVIKTGSVVQLIDVQENNVFQVISIS